MGGPVHTCIQYIAPPTPIVCPLQLNRHYPTPKVKPHPTLSDDKRPAIAYYNLQHICFIFGVGGGGRISLTSRVALAHKQKGRVPTSGKRGCPQVGKGLERCFPTKMIFHFKMGLLFFLSLPLCFQFPSFGFSKKTNKNKTA